MKIFSELKLNRSEPVALYYQVEKYIRDLIRQGELKPGDKLPTEIEMMEIFKISRTTIRKATDKLSRDNLIEIKKGQGTFIKAREFYEPVAGIISYTEEALKQGFTPITKIVEFNIIRADKEIAEILQLVKDLKVYKIIRLRILNEYPIGVDVTYIPVSNAPNFSKNDFEQGGIKQSLYFILKNKYNLILDQAEETFAATLTTKRDAELLGIKSKVPIILRKRVVFSPEKNPIFYMESSYKTSYKTVLRADTPSVSQFFIRNLDSGK